MYAIRSYYAISSFGVRSQTVTEPSCSKPPQLKSPGFNVNPSKTTIFIMRNSPFIRVPKRRKYPRLGYYSI